MISSVSYGSFSIPWIHFFVCLFAFQLYSYLSWNNKWFLEIIICKKCWFFLLSSILKRLHKNSPILIFFLILADVTAVLVQANTVVSNDVKDNYVPLQPSYKRNANQYFGWPKRLRFRAYSVNTIASSLYTWRFIIRGTT